MPKIAGGCLCGGVRYESTAEPKFVGVCHCTHCQKISGSAFSVNIIVPIDTVSMTTGSLATYQDTSESGRMLIRKFCKTCGSSLASESQSFPGMLVIKAGTLDDPSWVKPAAQIWARSRQPWVVMPGDLKAFEKSRS